MKSVYEVAAANLRTGRSSALVTVIRTQGSSPRKPGTKMIVDVDGTTIGTIGGGDLEKRVVEAALDAIAKASSQLVSFTLDREKGNLDMMCGGEIEFYIDLILPPERVVIFGAGHITRFLAPLLQAAGFRVTVIDDSPEFLQKEAFPGIEDLVHDDLEHAGHELAPDPKTYVVLLTRGFSRDKAVLRGLLGKGYPYIGMIGSMRKIASMIEELRAEGAPEDAFSRLYAPVGLDIGAETPEEIAISIAAEIVAAKKDRLDPAEKRKKRETFAGSVE